MKLHAVCTLAALTLAGCASVAQVTSLGEPSCRQVLERAFVTTLKAQGETDDVADRLASATIESLQYRGIGPRPFLVGSPSGYDYSFFVERKSDACLLRLYARQKGFVLYTNNLTYIATEPLAPCRCA